MPPARLDRLDHLLAQRGVDVVDDHLRAFGGQPLGDAFADAAAGAGHDDGFVLDAHGESLLVRYEINSWMRPDGAAGLSQPCRIATVLSVVKPYSASKPFSRP